MSSFIVSFITSLLITLLVIKFNHLHEHITSDNQLSGVQKFHSIPIPRIGGISILIGVLISLTIRRFQNYEVGTYGLTLLGVALPAFIAGFTEDLTKKVSISARLLATIISALLAGYMQGAWLQSLQIIGLDNLMSEYPGLSVIITCLAVAGVANSFNIIDGYNGLSASVGVIILAGLAYVAFQLGDYEIMTAAFVMIGALLGFLIWNYPLGLIFLGDGGAYLLGFWIAELSVLLAKRHFEISKWFFLLLCFYPVFETLFTIYRRIILNGSSPGMPDAAHLHHIIYKRLVRWAIGSDSPADKVMRNSLTSPYLWVLTSMTVIPAVLLWRNPVALQFFIGLFAVTYIILYRKLVKFNAPKWLAIRTIGVVKGKNSTKT